MTTLTTLATPSASDLSTWAHAMWASGTKDTDEMRIIARLLAFGMAQGWTVSVFDGMAWAVRRSRDIPTLAAALASTDTDTLRFRDGVTGQSVGSVMLIYGNGEDVISDHTDNSAMGAAFAFATA